MASTLGNSAVGALGQYTVQFDEETAVVKLEGSREKQRFVQSGDLPGDGSNVMAGIPTWMLL